MDSLNIQSYAIVEPLQFLQEYRFILWSRHAETTDLAAHLARAVELEDISWISKFIPFTLLSPVLCVAHLVHVLDFLTRRR